MAGSAAAKEKDWKSSIQKAQSGDKTERDAFITENVGLVYMVLKRFKNRGYDAEDLFQIGVIGLMKAVDKFDTSTEFSFSTYAVPMIIGEIRRFLRDDGILHISRKIKDDGAKVAAAKERISKTCQGEPTMERIMEETGLTYEEVLVAIEAGADVESIYKPIGNGTKEHIMVLADQLMDTRARETDLINKITVNQLLESLEEKERRLIELRYMEGKTQSESAKVLGMNQVAVSRLEKKILLYLRKQC
uniref:sigma-70 family RNA polymerase sigma factor n=1 Tax=Agathobacter sp. TaxID=2021311 RepID=UPI0040567524